MKKLWKIFKWFMIIIALLLLVLYATGNEYIIKGVRLTYLKGEKTANIDDYKDFDSNIILSDKPIIWPKHEKYNSVALDTAFYNEQKEFKTAGFLVVKDWKLLTEEYFTNYKVNSLTNSFSIAKTITALLLGKAIEDGHIKGLDQKITDFLPEFNNDEFGKQCTIGDLAAMTSGYDWKEDYYLPLNPTAKAYYGSELEKQMLERKFISEPGKQFKYLSGNTQLLGIILKRALGDKSLAQYTQEKFWQPMGMEYDAYWAKDNPDGIEKTYCCFSASTRDFAKFGELMRNYGKWNGKQIVDSVYVQKMITPNKQAFKNSNVAIYGLSVWMDYSYKYPFYAMLGHLGQRVIVVPSKNLVIVRTGKTHNDLPIDNPIDDGDVYRLVDEAVRIDNQL